MFLRQEGRSAALFDDCDALLRATEEVFRCVVRAAKVPFQSPNSFFRPLLAVSGCDAVGFPQSGGDHLSLTEGRHHRCLNLEEQPALAG